MNIGTGEIDSREGGLGDNKIRRNTRSSRDQSRGV